MIKWCFLFLQRQSNEECMLHIQIYTCLCALNMQSEIKLLLAVNLKNYNVALYYFWESGGIDL